MFRPRWIGETFAKVKHHTKYVMLAFYAMMVGQCIYVIIFHIFEKAK